MGAAPLDRILESLQITLGNAAQATSLAVDHIRALEAENTQLRARVTALEAQRKALGALGYLPPEPTDSGVQ